MAKMAAESPEKTHSINYSREITSSYSDSAYNYQNRPKPLPLPALARVSSRQNHVRFSVNADDLRPKEATE